MNKNDEKQITLHEQYPKLYSTPNLVEYGTLIVITQNSNGPDAEIEGGSFTF